MIPKTIHCVWLGDKQLPPIFNPCHNSWRIYAPDFEVQIWRQAELEKLPTFGSLLNKVSPPALASSIARAEILSLYGGVYLDCDIELCAASGFAGMLDLETPLLFGHNRNWVGDCLAGAPPQSEFFGNLVSRYTARLAQDCNGAKMGEFSAASWSEEWRKTRFPRLLYMRKRDREVIYTSDTNKIFAIHHAAKSWHGYAMRWSI